MNTEFSGEVNAEIEEPVRLKPLIDKLISAILVESVVRCNLIINNVSPELLMNINETKLALVIGNLICNVASFTSGDCLHIDVDSNRAIILKVKNTNPSRNKSFVVNLETILIIAERFGISLKLEEVYGKGTSVSVCILKSAA